jgi:hypothetical protein
VTTTAPKAKPKPSVPFVLIAMAEAEKHEEERWTEMQVSIELLASKVDSQGETQQQMVAQMDITTQALTRSVKDWLTLAQQLAATRDMVARLAADRGQEGGRDGPGTSSWFFGGQTLGSTPVLPNCSTQGRNHVEDEHLTPRFTLPKMPFPKFHGEHP